MIYQFSHMKIAAQSVPKHPVINPSKEKAEEYEKLIPYEELIKEAIKTKK